MTTIEALAKLKESLGVTLSVVGGKVVATPGGKLTKEQLAWLGARKNELLEILAFPDDATLDAVVARAWDDDPFGDNGDRSAVLRESLILRLPGTPAVAMDPAAYEELAAWNRRVLARQPGGKPAGRRKTNSANGIFGASESD